MGDARSSLVATLDIVFAFGGAICWPRYCVHTVTDALKQMVASQGICRVSHGVASSHSHVS